MNYNKYDLVLACKFHNAYISYTCKDDLKLRITASISWWSYHVEYSAQDIIWISQKKQHGIYPFVL